MHPVVSIIIPTYNRAHLLGRTIDSILNQTFQNWECLIVDDGSTDYTIKLMEFYIERDKRIKYFIRPKLRRKGANVCRNYGLQLSKGEYIQWFDSDDLMTLDFLQVKVEALERNNVDYVISKAANFRDPDPNHIIDYNEYFYKFKQFEFTNFNYVTQNINWLTPDFMGRREICSKVRFNENLKSAQERNFFSQLTCFNTNAKVLDIYLTKRRIHLLTTQSRFNGNPELRRKENLEFLYETWKDLHNKCTNENSSQYLIDNGLKITMENKEVSWSLIFCYTNALLVMNRFSSAFYYLAYQGSKKLINKGYVFRRRFLSNYELK